MTPGVIRSMFARVARKSAAGDRWASATRDFEIQVSGVDCRFRWKLQLCVLAVGESRQVTGECIVQALTAGGERCELAPGWIHFTAREDALAEPGPLFELALSDAKARLRNEPAFVARAELRAFEACISTVPGSRPSSRL